jgi:hypothetical protein
MEPPTAASVEVVVTFVVLASAVLVVGSVVWILDKAVKLIRGD